MSTSWTLGLVWGRLGLFWALILLGLLSGDAGPKSMVPTMPPFFCPGNSIFPGWKNTVFVTWSSSRTKDH